MAITLASNLLDPNHLTSTHYAGIDVSNIASLKYYNDKWQFTFDGSVNNTNTLFVDNSRVLLDGELNNYYTKEEITQFGTSGTAHVNYYEVTSNTLNVSGGVINLNNKLDICASFIPVTYSTFKILTNADLSHSELVSGNSAVDGIDNYKLYYYITETPISKNSPIKIDFKINYVACHEHDQTISFKVLRISGGPATGLSTQEYENNGYKVFEDISLGTDFGVTNRGVYFGRHIDLPPTGAAGWADGDGDTTQTYYLMFKVSSGSAGSVNISSGIHGYSDGYYNYMSLQELYRPPSD